MVIFLQKLAAAEKEISDLHSQLSELKTMAASHEGHLSSASNDNEAIEEAFQRYANTSLEAELVAKERQVGHCNHIFEFLENKPTATS